MTDRELVHQALDMLKQAKDAVADWGAYASNYFQHKHNLQGSIDDIQTQITVLSERLAQPDRPMTTCPHGMPHRWPCEICEPEQEPVAEVKLMMTGGNAGIATVIHEIDNPLRERLRPGQMLYTAPQPQPQRKPLTKDEIRDGARKTDPGGEDLCAWSFERGVRFAEAAHGIKGDGNDKTE